MKDVDQNVVLFLVKPLANEALALQLESLIQVPPEMSLLTQRKEELEKYRSSPCV